MREEDRCAKKLYLLAMPCWTTGRDGDRPQRLSSYNKCSSQDTAAGEESLSEVFFVAVHNQGSFPMLHTGQEMRWDVLSLLFEEGE